MDSTSPKLLSSAAELVHFLDDLESDGDAFPRLFIDLEGNNLSRHGTLSLITILAEGHDQVDLVDVTKLGKVAFCTTSSSGQSLRDVLESESIIKVFFDIRNDSDALYSLYGIRMGGVEDLQLMELAARKSSKRYVSGLAKCVKIDSGVDWQEMKEWENVQQRGCRLSTLLWEDHMQSSTNDPYVQLMPRLHEVYLGKLCDAWWEKIEEETRARIKLSQSSSYQGKGQHKAFGPSKWLFYAPSHAQLRIRTVVSTKSARKILKDAIVPRSDAEKVQDQPNTGRRLESVRL